MKRDEIRNWVICGGLSLLFTFGIIFFALGPCLDFILERAVQRLPLAVENDLGGRLLGHIAREGASKDPKLAVILKSCAEALREPEEKREFEILLVENPEVNAFALPGGHLVLYRGLIDKLQDQHELMAVLGHEAGHVRQRHFLQRIARAGSIGLAFTLLFGDTTGVIAVMTDSGKDLMQMSYSREEEKEADDEGLNTLKRLGMDPFGAERAMQRLVDARSGINLPEILSTHPDSEKRQQRLLLAAKELPKGNKELLTTEQWEYIKSSGTLHSEKKVFN